MMRVVTSPSQGLFEQGGPCGRDDHVDQYTVYVFCGFLRPLQLLIICLVRSLILQHFAHISVYRMSYLWR
jgi:hypothetical protein